jgi:hypothetical protein
VTLRRFREGDHVRFRPQSNLRFGLKIAVDEVGTVVWVEPHPPQTGPTYRVSVEFPEGKRVDQAFEFEFELVEAAPEK